MFYFLWIFLQVQTKEDDLEADFYDDLIPLEDNKDQEALGSGLATSSFRVPIFYSSKRSQSSSHSSAFKQAIQASQKKVIKVVLDLLNFSWKITPIPAIVQGEGDHFNIK